MGKGKTKARNPVYVRPYKGNKWWRAAKFLGRTAKRLDRAVVNGLAKAIYREGTTVTRLDDYMMFEREFATRGAKPNAPDPDVDHEFYEAEFASWWSPQRIVIRFLIAPHDDSSVQTVAFEAARDMYGKEADQWLFHDVRTLNDAASKALKHKLRRMR